MAAAKYFKQGKRCNVMQFIAKSFTFRGQEGEETLLN
jgi:hypothetical protein